MESHLTDILLTSTALALACAVLSVVVVLRRWAFIGEGIGHSGFGGAGTAWLLMLLIPALDKPWVPYLGIVIFCLLTALAIGAVSRWGSGVGSDAAIGIFMVASLAWGFLAQEVYVELRHTRPSLFFNLLFGQFVSISPQYMRATVIVCLLVLLLLIGLWKEVLAYAFDPLLAATSGVRSGVIHYMLMLLIALVVIVGIHVAGSVLVTALLVLPGATGLLLSKKLARVLAISIGVAMIGAIGGLLLNRRFMYVPAGPTIVLLMFIQFLVAWLIGRLRLSTGSA